MKTNPLKLALVLTASGGMLYGAVVIAFEAGLLFLQPTWQGTLILTTTDEAGNHRERVIAGLRYQGQLYIRANHWPRQWYHEAIAHPAVMVDRGDGPVTYTAVPVAGEEAARVNSRHRIRLRWRILTGFPPLQLLRLDPA